MVARNGRSTTTLWEARHEARSVVVFVDEADAQSITYGPVITIERVG